MPAVPTHYCLRCYLPLGSFESSREICTRCGHVNLRVDQDVYWTQEPAIRRLELAVKALIVVLSLWVASWIEPKGNVGRYWTIYQYGFPLFIGCVLFVNASRITRKRSAGKPRLGWALFFLSIPLAPIVFGALVDWESFYLLVAVGAGAWIAFKLSSRYPGATRTAAAVIAPLAFLALLIPFTGRGPASVIVVVFGVPAALVWWGAGAIERWKERRVLRGAGRPA